MMKKNQSITTIIILALAFVFTAATGSHKLKTYKVSTKSNSVELLIPENLSQLSNDDAIATYGMARTPMGVFADAEKNVSIIISVKPIPSGSADNLDLTLEKRFKKSALAVDFGNINFIKEEVTEINGQSAIVFEFESSLYGKDVEGKEISSANYTYIAYIYKKDREYSINFSTPAALKTDWQNDAALIINSIKTK